MEQEEGDGVCGSGACRREDGREALCPWLVPLWCIAKARELYLYVP